MGRQNISEGDRVKVYFTHPGCFEGVVTYTPCATGDSFTIVKDDGMVVYVQTFTMMERLQEAPND